VNTIKKIYDILLKEDSRVINRKPDHYRTIFDDHDFRVDIKLYLTDTASYSCIATVNVSYKKDDLEIETKYDSGTPPTSEPERILDIIQNGIDDLWGGAPHFIWFNRTFIKDE